MNSFRVFDIETGPLPREVIIDLIPPAKYGNTKDPEKRAAIDKEHLESEIEEAAKHALTGRILAFGSKDHDGPPRLLILDDEKALILEAWRALMAFRADSRFPLLVGFNIYGFDLPFLVRRSIVNGVEVPAGVRRGRYWDRNFVDLQELWQCGDRYGRGSLDSITRACGISNTKKGSGAFFARLLTEDPLAARDYLTQDLMLTEALAVRFGVRTMSA